MHDKQRRLIDANAVLRAMGSHGRKFFYSDKHKRYAEIIIDAQGRLRIVDDCSGKPVLIVRSGEWRGFTHGGTCRAIVEDLANYVRTGKKTRNHFGASKVRDSISGNPEIPF